MRSWASVRLLLLAVLLGVPIAAGAFWFLKITELLQEWAFTDVPNALGYDSVPARWPLVPLVLAGMIVGAVIRYLPGDGGESPAEGFKAGGIAPARTLPGILLAAVASIGLGAVLGPEMPLIAVGGGLACLTVRLANRDVPAQTGAVAVATGSFAAISTLLGTPLAGAFLLLEASSVGGAAATAVLLPGLLGAGIGSLVFTGLNSVTGYGTFSLAVPDLPPVGAPAVAEFGWALAIGLVAAPLAVGLRWLAVTLRDRIRQRLILATTLMGLVIAVLAIRYAEVTGHDLRCPVLRPGRLAGPAKDRRRVLRRGAAPARRVQGAGIRSSVERLPRRPGLPRPVHRRGRRHPVLAPAGAAPGTGRRDGDERDDRGDGCGCRCRLSC